MKTISGFFLSILVFMGLSISAFSYAEEKDPVIEIANKFVDSLISRDFSEIDKSFDKQGFAEKTVAVMGLSKRDSEAMKSQFIKSSTMQTIIGNGLSGMDKDSLKAKMIGVMTIKNRPVPVVRINLPNGGSNYYELAIKKINGRYLIQDIFIAANARNLTETIGQATAMMLDQPSGWIASFVDEGGTRENIVKIITESINFRKKGDFESMYTTLQKLPEKIKHNDTVHLMILMASSNMDEKIYRKELSIFAQNHGKNPRYAFMLIDHYFYNEQYDLVLDSIDKLLNRYKKDASLLTMKANTLFMMKEYTKAYAAVQLALDFEPEYEDAYWSGVTISLDEKNHKGAISWLKMYESQFDYSFDQDDFENQDLYKDLIASAEFNSWMQSRKE
jgi:tetratricopeptide (TPR) repeat protein